MRLNNESHISEIIIVNQIFLSSLGTNMMTYKNRCELEKAACESGGKFDYAHHGPCEGKKSGKNRVFESTNRVTISV